MARLYGIYLQKVAGRQANQTFSLFEMAGLCICKAPRWSGDPLERDPGPGFLYLSLVNRGLQLHVLLPGFPVRAKGLCDWSPCCCDWHLLPPYDAC